ncbi:ATP-dependent RNA helicase SrmB [Dongshaea marina]|uniref:ATP-dependent RNA helicase SrmB n=1 Tax=Dongshaea marina TaxID=2047966 RepID=UPI000D3E48E6|nr:ATP-dependent RNA helicase SrmB [Dongshaea marina]
MSFENFDLDENLLRALEQLNFARPTTIQKMVLPEAMDGRDIMASAPTGTGKTAAFLLPALQHMLDFPRRQPGPPRVLVLTPTRELAMQIEEQAKALSQFCKLNCGVITGGVDHAEQRPLLEKNLDLLIATPGRLMEYMDEESFDSRAVEILILDEADRMLDMGFSKEVHRIAGECRWRRQSMLFSATLEGEGLQRFCEELLTEPAELNAEPPKRERGKIHQWIHLADHAEHKFALLTHLLRLDPEHRSIVFVKTRERLHQLVGQLTQAGLECTYLRGEMDQKKRNESLTKFREKRSNILVATDVAARGLDIPDVTHVINYDLPWSADVYLHRIGRTARAGAKGSAISLVEAHDIEILGKIERYMQHPMKRRTIAELPPKHREARPPKKAKKSKMPKKGKGAKGIAKKQRKKSQKPSKKASS